MGFVAGKTGEFDLPSINDFCLFCLEGMPLLRFGKPFEPLDRMRLYPNPFMTLEAEIISADREEMFRISIMGAVARHALPGCHWRMDILTGKFLFVMAGKTEIRNPGKKEFCGIGLVGRMAAGAHPACNRRMYHLLSLKIAPSMTTETELRGLLCEEFLFRGSMWVMAGCAESAFDRCMDIFFAGKDIFLMTGKTEVRRSGNKEFLYLTAVRVMARGAHAAGHWGMGVLVRELVFVMTSETHIRHP